jgi:alpha-L-fucosidase
MANYDISQQTKPRSDSAYIELFFTQKNKDLYAIVPAFSPVVTIRDITFPSTATVSILGYNKKMAWKQKGKDVVIDLSNWQPGDLPNETFVIKLKNAIP